MLWTKSIVRDGSRPDRGEEFILRDETFRVFDEMSHDPECAWPKGNFILIEQQTAASQIEDEAIER